MPKIEYWKDADGKIRTQDSQYRDKMLRYGFTPATDEEIKNAGTINASIDTRRAPSTAAPSTAAPVIGSPQAFAPAEPPPPPVDKDLVERIKATGVDEEEAVQRATRVSKLMAATPNAPVLRQGKDEFGDIPSTIGTTAEGIAAGLSFGILPFLEGKAGDFAEELGALDNPFTSANIERRRQASPTINLVADIGAGLAQAGVGALKSIAPRLFTRAAEVPLAGAVVRGLESTDVVGKYTRLASSDAAERALTKLATKEGVVRTPARQLATEELLGIETKLADAKNVLRSDPSYAAASDEVLETLAREKLSSAERSILDISRQAQKPTAVDVVESGLRKAGSKVTGGRIAEKTPTQVAKGRAIADREKYIIERDFSDAYSRLGFGEKAKYAITTGLANAGTSAAVGSVRGGITAAQRNKLLEAEGVSQEQIDALGDSVGASMWDGFKTGGLFAGALSLGIPLADGAMRWGLNLVKDASSKLAQSVIPAIGSRTTPLTADELKFGVKIADFIGQTNVESKLDELANALQWQYDNVEQYIAHVNNSHVRAGLSPTAPSNLQLKLQAFQDQFMKKDPDTLGRYIIDRKKFDRAIMSQPVAVGETPSSVTSGYQIVGEVQFPAAIQDLQDEISGWEAALAHISGPSYQGDVYRAPAIGGLPMQENMGFVVPKDLTGGRIRAGEVPDPSKYTATQIRELEEMNKYFSEKLQAGWAPADYFIKLGVPGSISAAAAATAESVVGAFGAGLGAAAISAPVTAFAYNLLVNPPAAVNNYVTFLKTIQKAETNRKFFVESLTRSGQARSIAERTVAQLPVVDTFGAKRDMLMTLSADTAKMLYDNDKALLGKLESPDAIGQVEDVFGKDYELLDAAYPSVGQVAKDSLGRQIKFLSSKMPKLPQGWDTLRQGEYVPSPQQLYQYGMYSRYVHNPEVIYSDIAKKKYVPDQAIEVLTQVYPQFYSVLKSRIYDALIEMSDSGGRVDAKQQAIIDKLLGNTTRGLTRAQIMKLQSDMNVPPAKGGGIPSGESGRVRLEREGTTSGK